MLTRCIITIVDMNNSDNKNNHKIYIFLPMLMQCIATYYMYYFNLLHQHNHPNINFHTTFRNSLMIRSK